MKNNQFFILFLLIFLLLLGSVEAHVQLDYPSGGETFVSGETVNIRWHVIISHLQENWDLHYSPNGGTDWYVIILNLDPSVLNFNWIVPTIATENAQVRISMDNTGTDYYDISGDFSIQQTSTFVDPQKLSPNTFALFQNYPNPFNPSTTICYELSVTSNIELTIYNQSGQKIRTLVNERQIAKNYQIQWDGKDNKGNNTANGLYIYRLKVNSKSRDRKMLMLK